MTRNQPRRPSNAGRRGSVPDRLSSVVVQGVVISDVRVMESAYEGVCKQTGKPIRKGDLMIYKHADKLTDAEHDAWCRALGVGPDSPKAYRAVVALYDEVINQRPATTATAPAEVIVPESHGKRSVAKRWVVLGPPKEPASEYQQHILDVLWSSKRHIVIRALAGCGKTNTLRRIAWALRQKLVLNRETGKRVSLMHGRSVTYLAYNRRLKDEVAPLLFGTGVDPRTTHSFFLRVLGLTPDECDYEGNLDRERFMMVLCNRAGLPFNPESVKKVRKESEFYKLRGQVQQLIDFTKHWAILPAWTGDCWVFGQDARRQMSDLIDKYRMLVDEEVREDVISLAAATIAVGIPHPGAKPTRVTGEDILYLPLVLDLAMPKLDMVLADEIQDFNLCQIMLIRRLADAGARIVAVGDPLQCVIDGTQIAVPAGQVPAESVANHQAILSINGNNVVGDEVTEVHSREVQALDVVTIKTKSGKCLTTTTDHTHFAGYVPGESAKWYFVYLMYREDMGYRIGTTRELRSAHKPGLMGFQVRSNQENADALWLLGAYESEAEARYWETYYSLTYSIPTWVFQTRHRGVVYTSEHVGKLFAAIDTRANAERLLESLGMFIDHPHYRPKCMTSTRRRNFSITLCGDARGKTTLHRYAISGSSLDDGAKLAAVGLNVRDARGGGWRVESSHANMGAIYDILQLVRMTIDVNLIQKAKFGKTSLPFIPASHILPGMTVFVRDGDAICEDVVLSVERHKYTGKVHCFNTARFHNYIANGIVTHNCIYGFRGATGHSFERLEATLGESAKGAETCILPVNYRSSVAVIDNAQKWAPELRGFKTDPGEIRDDATFESMVEWFATGDTSSVCVLSRTNDPLFKAALETLKEFIRQRVTNKRVCVLGKRSIGRPLISLVELVAEETKDRPECVRISDRLNDKREVVEPGLLSRIDEHVAQQFAKFGQDERYAEQLARLSSNVECIKVVCQMVADDKVESVVKTIDTLCTDKPRPGDIVFSTVHGAKGLEWRDVFVIKCDLFPFPAVKMLDENGEVTEQGQEELNIMYVRDTRPIMNLYYVANWFEKDQSGAIIDVHSLLDVDRAYGEDGDEDADFWDADRPERPVTPPALPSQEDDRKALEPAARKAGIALPPSVEPFDEFRGQESTPAASAAPVRVVQPKNNPRKWVDNGEPF